MKDDAFDNMAEKGVFVVDRMVQERMNGGADLQKDVWYVPLPEKEMNPVRQNN